MTVKSLCSVNRSSGRDGAVKTAIKLKTAPEIVPTHAAKSNIVRGAPMSLLHSVMDREHFAFTRALFFGSAVWPLYAGFSG